MKSEDHRTVALDNVAKTGSKKVLKAAVAFQNHPTEWMSIEDVAAIVGQSPNTVRIHSVRELFNAQIVRRKYTYDEDLEPTAKYKLRTMDDELEELAERARKSVGGKKTKIHSGMSVIDGGAREAKSK